MKSKSQKQLVLEHLQQETGITSWEAIQRFRATRLSDIIYKLKRDGWNIVTINRTNPETKKQFAEYRLVKGGVFDGLSFQEKMNVI